MAQTTPPHISARIFYGLQTNIQCNAHYLSDTEILYPAGGVLTIHNHYQKKQKFIRLQDKVKPIKSLILAPNRRWLALNEQPVEGQKPVITIYDLSTYKRRKILSIPFDYVTAKEFACMQFSFDSKYLIAITGEPDWLLMYYNWDKGKVESIAKAQNPNGSGTVDSVQCNPADATLIVITGPYTFRIMNVVETVWRQWGWSKCDNIIITAAMWLTPDRIMFGTNTGMIMMVENGELRHNCVFKANEVIEMQLKKVDLVEEAPAATASAAAIGEGEEAAAPAAKSDEESVSEESDEEECRAVKFFVNFPKGFIFTCGPGYVHMFEKESSNIWRKRNLYRISRKSYRHTREQPVWSPLDAIQHLTVDPSQETILITTLRKQLYYVKLFGQHMLQNPEIPFVELGPPMHYGPINCLAVCAWKPIFITSGEYDKSIRIWNFMTDEVEMIRLYQEEVHSLSLHPTGLFVIVGFSDKLRYMVILIDDLEVMREFPIRNCKQARFSSNGHLFAAVNGQIIQVFSSVSFNNMFNLKGHNGKITGLSWSANDAILVSCGLEGAVYEWSMSNGLRVGEIIMKTNAFKACAVNSVGKTTYAVGADCEIKEIGSNTIRRNLGLTGMPLDTILLSRSDMMLFISGGNGGICAVQLPLLDKAIFSEFHMHNMKVTCLALTYDDQTLISVAEDSSICLWRLTNADGRAIALDKDFSYSKEILISKRDLQEKINSISLLSTRISELETEHEYQLRQAEATQADKLKEVHEGYGAAIEELKEKIDNMENDHSHEIGMIQQDILKIRGNHERALQTLESDFNLKLIGEYDRYQSLEDKTARMRKEYEERLEELAESKRQAIRELNDMFETKLEEKEIIISELQEQAEAEKREHDHIKLAIEDDADREIIEIRTSYESQLKEEKDANVRLKGETGLMKKKLMAAMKEIEEFKHHINQLKAEHVQFQKVIGGLERDVADLKSDIEERDLTIQEKEKRIYELKRKKQELEKYKFVLNFKIIELKNQIEPKQKEIKELTEQIQDMENEEHKLLVIKHELGTIAPKKIEPLEREIKEKKIRVLDLEISLENLLKKRAFRELFIKRLQEKLESAKKDFQAATDKNLLLKSTLKKIKIDLHNMTANFEDPKSLKSSVKALFHKYTEDIDFIRSRIADDEAIREFNRHRDHLEKQVAGLRLQLSRALTGSKGDLNKIMDENTTLLSEINSLRVELKTTRARCFQMESILGLSARYMPPTVARAKLKYATEAREKLDEQFGEQIGAREDVISGLKEENERLMNKITCSDDEEDLNTGPSTHEPYKHSRISSILNKADRAERPPTEASQPPQPQEKEAKEAPEQSTPSEGEAAPDDEPEEKPT